MKKVVIGLLATIVLASCSSINNIATKEKIEKRKYTSGFFVSNFFKKHKITHAISKGKTNEKLTNDTLQTNIDEQFANCQTYLIKQDDSKEGVVSLVTEVISNPKQSYNANNIKQLLKESHQIKKQYISTVSMVRKSKSHSHSSNGEKFYSITSFVLSLIGLLIIPLLFGSFAIAYGITALFKKNKLKGLAIAGIIIGILNILYGLYAIGVL